MKNPKITVLMPVYNAETYLKQATDSILSQTFTDFEFLIIDDGSSDKSADIIKSYSDERIRYISNATNNGLSYSLNRGLDLAQGEYIARMDSDDISLPKRLETQVRFMDAHPEIGLCGSWYKSFGQGRPSVNKVYTASDDIKANLLFYSSFAHPTVILRKSFFDESGLRYDDSLRVAEDIDLWTRCIDRFSFANIDTVLLMYRIHDKGNYQSFKRETVDIANNSRLRLLAKLGLKVTQEEKTLHNMLRPDSTESIGKFIRRQEAWLSKIVDANRISHLFKEDSLSKVIYERWRTICGMNAKGGLAVWKTFASSPLYTRFKQKSILDSTKIFVKCLLRR